MKLYGAINFDVNEVCYQCLATFNDDDEMGDITDWYIAWQSIGEQIKQFMKSKSKLTGVEAVSLQDR